MTDEQKIEEIEENDGSVTISNGAKFFDPPEQGWFILTLALAGILFFFWAIKAEIDLQLVAIIVPVYMVSVIIPFRSPYRESEIIDNDGAKLFIFRRSGFAWQTLLDAILGSAVPIVIVSFFISQGIPSSPELNRTLMLLAMIIYVFIIPVIPLLGSIKRLSILKTVLSAELDDSGLTVKTLVLDVNPLDGYWYKNRDDPELLESIIVAINDLLKVYT